MNELKNLRNYEEFKDAVNEEFLWDAVKNLFSKIFAKIDKKLADAVANFTKKLDGSKTWEESVKFYEEIIKVEMTDMNTSIQTITGPLGMRKVISDNSSIVFIQLQELSNKYGSADLAAKKIFAGQSEAAMFNFDKSEQFNNNLLAASNAKMVELSKGIYDQNALNTYLTNHKELDKVEEQKPVDQSNNQHPEQKNIEQTPSTTNPEKPAMSGGNSSGGRNQNLSVDYRKFKNKLNEEVELTPTDTSTTATNPNTPPAGDIKNMIGPITKWLSEQLYGFTLKKIKEMKAPDKIGQVDAFDTVAKGSKATTLYPNLAKLLRNIVNITDKNQLLKVRDATATAIGKTPEDFKKEIPL